MSVIQRTAFDSSRIKQKIKQTSYNQNKSKGPLKASYEVPTKNWQVKYTYNSPKIVQNGNKFSRALEESSEYGTMENCDPAVPLINLTQTDQDPSFNDVSIAERRERIGSILDEIVSIPRLAEANITQRSLSQSSMARFTGGGSVRASRASQISNRDRVFPSSRQSRLSSMDNKSSKLRQDRVLQRSVSSPKLTEVPEKKKKTRAMAARSVSRTTTARSEVPRLELSVTQSEYRGEGRGRSRPSKREEELSAEFLPVHNTASLRPVLSDQTQSELVLAVPSMEDETMLATAEEDDTFDMNPRTTDFVKANMKAVGGGAGARTGRSSAVSNTGSVGSVGVPHKAGSVPRYLRTRQAQWAEAAAAALAAIPDPDCPPGHVRLPEEQRLEMVASFSSQHAGLLQDLNRLPVSSDSRKVVNRRKELETSLNQMEEEIRKFSRQKVFVPVEGLENNDIL